MKPAPNLHELLLRHLDGRLDGEEKQRVEALLRDDPAARAFLREVAEQAVMFAELERSARGRQAELHSGNVAPGGGRSKILQLDFRGWVRAAAAAAVIMLLAALAIRALPPAEKGFLRITKVHGSSQYLGANGKVESVLEGGTVVGVGDTLETRTCDAWIELSLKDGLTMTVAGHSILRILDTEKRARRFKLSQGNLWVSPKAGQSSQSVSIQTPTITLEAAGAQFDLQTSSAETMLRVNEGTAFVRQLLDGSVVEVPAGHQVAASLSRKGLLTAVPQPQPINYWACDLWQVPEVKLGKWLPPSNSERARLGAEPLLWPVPGRDPVMLYAVALAAWKSTEHPVLLQSDSRLRIRGRTEKAQPVRFGFSAQKMQGVFAGKFEMDVKAEDLAPAGETWEVELPLSSFRPLNPKLSPSPDGLELTDLYALTVREDAGLEINHIELVPRQSGVALPAQRSKQE